MCVNKTWLGYQTKWAIIVAFLGDNKVEYLYIYRRYCDALDP